MRILFLFVRGFVSFWVVRVVGGLDYRFDVRGYLDFRGLLDLGCFLNV